ncbi:BgTH12-07354 [Blumeria graminis f. sp. triticale]|uniref:non-specific serine/threonine protein kinase n=1 Tax=Blumeria graminis f. sp. triticale TaxID=1689686 RepID=A0A9W4D954_BLUGR|nr:BgTH12-07354 [Blumeria graminis f. sp. triticale]
MSLNRDIAAHLAEKPLGKVLRSFRSLYKDNFPSPQAKVFGNPKNADECREPLEDLILKFIAYIQRSFDTPTQVKKLLSRLRTIESWMYSTTFDLVPFEPVATLILNQATDLEIWNSLILLVDELEKIMSATEDQLEELATESIYRRVVESSDGAQMNMEDLKQALSGELEGSDLIKAYRSPSHSATNDAANTAEERVGLAFTGAQFHTLAAGKIIGNQTKRQVDYFIKSRNLPTEDRHHWRDILVVGELTVSSSKVSRQKFLQLSVYMREVFMAQPLRRFVHGFILFEKDLQLWVYDRSGPYSCSYIDIGKSPEKLVHVLPNVKYEGEDMIVHLEVPGSKDIRKFTLDPNPISQQKAYLCRGTSCFKDRTLSCVVKFSWRICDGLSEIELLEMADNIPGMAKILGSANLVKISQLREGLLFTKSMVKDTRPTEKIMTTPYDLSGEMTRIPKESVNNQLSRKRKREALQAEKEMAGSIKKARSMQESRQNHYVEMEVLTNYNTDTTVTQQVTELNPPVSSLQALKIPNSGRAMIVEGSAHSVNQSSGKRKTADDAEVNDRLKRVQLSSNAGLIAMNNSAGPSSLPEKAPNPPKSSANARSCSTKAVKMVNTEVIIPRDRQFTAAGISPYGRPIDKFRSALELIIGISDAIKAHRSLLMDAKILHRDISVNNILLTGIETSDKLGGVLIDLDLATLLKDGKVQEKDRVVTGTMQFIALDILSNSFATTGAVVTHTYRHDLESFLYVLVWVCINCGWNEGTNPHKAFLSKWYIGTAREIHRNKLDDIKRDSLDEILYKFSPIFEDVKGLVEEFRDLLFNSNIKTRTGNLEDPNKLYEPIIAAFDRAIEALKM